MFARTGVRTTVHDVQPTLLLAACAAAAALTVPVTRWAATRSTRQPIDAHPDAEQEILAHLAATPGDYPRVAALEPADFTVPAHQDAWTAIRAACSDVPIPDPDSRTLNADLADAAKQVPDLTGILSAYVSTPHALEHKALEKAGQQVMDAALDRQTLTGLSPLVTTGDPARPLARTYQQPGWARAVVTAVILAAGFTASLILAGTASSTAAYWTAAAAGAVVTLGAVVWTLVDLDTLYVDMPTVWPVTGVAVGFTAASAVLDGKPERILTGLVTAAAVMAVLEGTNLLHRLIRGQWGLGGGDKYIIPAAIGVPVSLSGAWMFGYPVIMAALLTSVAAWVVLKAAERGGRHVPFAFVPYLATGWITATITTALTGAS